MLPALPSLLPTAHRFHRSLQGLVLATLLLLSLGLSGCGRLPQPPHATVVSALSLQIELTQQAIAEALDLPPAAPASVRHVRIEAQREIAIADGRGLHLSGHFDWRLDDDPQLVESPFELDLQRGERGQSWRLARPVASDDAQAARQWLIDPLPIPS